MREFVTWYMETQIKKRDIPVPALTGGMGRYEAWL